MFIWRDDNIGNIIAKELLDAADRGVKVEISKDKYGAIFEKSEDNRQSLFHKNFDLDLWIKHQLIYFFYYNHNIRSKQIENDLVKSLLNHHNISVSNHKARGDHSKYFIFDDEHLILGGMNIEDRTVYADADGQRWNDYMVDVSGKSLVTKLKATLSGEDDIEDSWFRFVVNSKSPVKYFNIKSTMMDLLDSAKKEVFILMAYYGDKDITKKIIELVNSGIDVTIILPKNAIVQNDYNYKVVKEILVRTDNRAKVFLCNNMLHAKLVYLDEDVVFLGSANMNKQTMKQLCELNVLVNGNIPFTDSVKRSIEEHIKNSVRVEHVDQLKFNPVKGLIEGIFC